MSVEVSEYKFKEPFNESRTEREKLEEKRQENKINLEVSKEKIGREEIIKEIILKNHQRLKPSKLERATKCPAQGIF